MKKEPLKGALPPHLLAELPPETPVLLALSGGADSTALLHLLSCQREKYGFPLVAAHVNHGIRGADAVHDAEFCSALAAEFGVPLFLKEADVPSMVRASGRSVEEEARLCRYSFFSDLMERENFPILVTAHHADDQAETVLFRLSRGTGLHGLCGISPCRAFGTGVLVRPLLHCTRQEILSYCDRNRLSYVEDATNADISYARNRIRQKILPELEALFERPQERIAAMCDTLREDEAFLISVAETTLRELGAGEPLCLDLKRLNQTALPIRRRVLLLWVEQVGGRGAERVHLEALLHLCEARRDGEEVLLPGKLLAFTQDGFLCARRGTRCERTPAVTNPEIPSAHHSAKENNGI